MSLSPRLLSLWGTLLVSSQIMATPIASTSFETSEGFPANRVTGGFKITDAQGTYWETGAETGNYSGTWTGVKKSGSQCCVFGDYGNKNPYLLIDPVGTAGVGTLEFWIKRTGGSGNPTVHIQYTTDVVDGNETWTTFADQVVIGGDPMTQYTFAINQPGDVKLRIFAPSVGNHVSVDDFVITAFEPVIEEVPVLVTIGQSNSDGWGAAWNFDYDELEKYQDPRFPNRMGATIKTFYDANPEDLKIFYKALNGQPLYATTPSVPALEKSWIDLNYQSDLANGKANMVSRQSIGTQNDRAKYARSMEAPFGYYWKNGTETKAAQNSPLYVIKTAAGGSPIRDWNTSTARNWQFFRDQVYQPAIQALIAQGKKPKLIGVYWMQGETDRNSSTYENDLDLLADLIRAELGFPDVRLYIGAICGKSWNPNGTTPAYLAQKSFCNDPLNNAVLIDNYEAQRKFHGDMTVTGFTQDPTYADAATYGYGEIWTSTTGYQRDLGSSGTHSHYTAGALADIGKDLFELVVDTPWANLQVRGDWANLVQTVGDTQTVTFMPTFPTGGVVTVIEFEQPTNTWTTTQPAAFGNYNVRATLVYNQGLANEFTLQTQAQLSLIEAIGEQVFVVPNGNGSGNSWEDAFGDIQTAIDTAATQNPPLKVKVAGGNYSLSAPLTLPAGVELIGGFTIDGNSASRPLNENAEGPWDFVNKTTLTTSGVTFGNLTAEHVVIDGIEAIALNNSAEIIWGQGEIKNSIFDGQGLGFANHNFTRTISGSKIHNNQRTAISNWGTSAGNSGSSTQSGTTHIIGCKVENVTGSAGTVIFSANATHILNLVNTVVANCHTTRIYRNTSGVVGSYGANSTVNIENCTIVNNTTNQNAAAGGTGAFVTSSGTLNVVNSIVWNNVRDTRPEIGNYGSQLTVTTSASSESNFTVTHNSVSNIQLAAGVNPGFADLTTSNWSLAAESALINAGSQSTQTTDLLGQPRVFNSAHGGITDLGAYEYQSPALREVIYGNVTDLTAGAPFPTLTIVDAGTDNRLPAPTWAGVKIYTDAACTIEAENSNEIGVYYAKGSDSTGNWQPANSATIQVVPATSTTTLTTTTVADATSTTQFVTMSTTSPTEPAIQNNPVTIYLELAPGWNLLSHPFSEITDAAELGAVSSYWVLANAEYVELSQLPAALHGFWVYSETLETVALSGLLTTNHRVTLQPGWNLFGPAEDTTAPLALDYIEAVTEADQQTLKNEGRLTQGRGYWMYSETMQTITF